MTQEDISSFKRLTLPLILSSLFVIAATVGSYRSIYLLEVVDETADNKFVTTRPLLFNDEPKINREQLLPTGQFEEVSTHDSFRFEIQIANQYQPYSFYCPDMLHGRNYQANSTYRTITTPKLQKIIEHIGH